MVRRNPFSWQKADHIGSSFSPGRCWWAAPLSLSLSVLFPFLPLLAWGMRGIRGKKRGGRERGIGVTRAKVFLDSTNTLEGKIAGQGRRKLGKKKLNSSKSLSLSGPLHLEEDACWCPAATVVVYTENQMKCGAKKNRVEREPRSFASKMRWKITSKIFFAKTNNFSY